MSGVVAQNVARPSGLVKAVSAGGGAWVLIKTLTSGGSDDDLSFVDGASDVVLDSTYPIYCFKWTSIHPETDNANFGFLGSSDTGSNYNVAKQSTWWKNTYDEAASSPALSYDNGMDLALGTGLQNLNENTGSDADQCCSGYLFLFAPSDTTFTKQFLAECSTIQGADYIQHAFVGGYFNTASVIDAFQFKFSSGEIQGGKIKLFGIKDS